MESTLYSIDALAVFVSEISLVRCAYSFDFWYINFLKVFASHFRFRLLALALSLAFGTENIKNLPHALRAREKIFQQLVRIKIPHASTFHEVFSISFLYNNLLY